MKYFPFSLLGLVVALAGCTADIAPVPAEPVQPLAPPSAEAPAPKTTFDFYPAALQFEEGGEDSAEFSVRFHPEEGVSLVEVALRFDPQEVAINNFVPQQGLVVFASDINEETGIATITAGIKENDRNPNAHMPVLTASAQLLGGISASEISFVAEKLSALMPDANNTQTAQTQNLPRLRLVRKAAEVSLDQLEEPEAL